MSKKHTPAPWTGDEHGITSKSMPDVFFGDNKQYSRSYIVCQPWLYSDPQGEELKANARLIAAAPDLLESVQALLTVIDEMKSDVPGQDCEWNDCVALARTAIAKATGE